MSSETKPILVIGGGIAGMTAAIEAAEVGVEVVLVEREAFLGGRVVRTHRYVTGRVAIDDAVIAKLESERDDEFNLGLGRTKALYLPHEMAWPTDQVLDREALSAEDAETLATLCPPGAIELDMEEQVLELEVGAVVVATGWRPYDATRLDNLGYGACDNVITNVVMERLAAPGGPTGGRILRPSDGEQPRNVAFVQCAGSRDENHLPYCSAVCCMATLKQARYLRDANDETRVTIFYIDIRTIGRNEKFYYDLLDDEGVSFVKGKVAGVREDGDKKNLVLDVEDTIAAETRHEPFDLVVLATGIVPNLGDLEFPFDLSIDAYGFLDGAAQEEGVYVAGCAHRPCDVSRSTKDATGAALRAIQCVRGGE